MNITSRCKDGCCPQREPYPTVLTVIAAIAMAGIFGAVIAGFIAAIIDGEYAAALVMFMVLGIMFGSLRGNPR